ncbi:receptor-type tyrosine-protein phosphatase eta isoform X2 [Morone saxatilis]|uniref:receptor-type tyrosine-protein phosphatase eta isoform X2 n=1 Tax=Morone saxatilis TaxID=34816 RepID=UPI0015E1DB65|nr:receptor-type tyrosine-protein phosphatase eta isoform X2 [Morone saxatilis]
MKPLLRSGVSVWTLLVFSALLKISEATCPPNVCESDPAKNVTTNTTAVTFDSTPKCNLSIEGGPSGKGSITDLIPGTVYEINFSCLNCCKSFTTKPGKIMEHKVNITTFSISLTWNSPLGEVFQYKVEWHNGGSPMSRNTNSTSTVLSDLIPGTNYTVTIIAFAGDNTSGEPYTFTVVTNPAVVRNLSVTEVTTSSVFLTWTEPQGNASSYIVQWTAPADSLNSTTTNTSFTIEDLTPGFVYNISVIAVASSNIGERITKTTYTRPEKPVNITVEEQGTTNLNISWTLPKGRVDHYVVNILNEGNNKTKVNTAHISGLKPGRVFVITVTAVAGNFSDTSEKSFIATYPTPPGSPTISGRTNSSLRLNWQTPALMEDVPNISYHITYQPEGGEANSTVNNTELSPLSSGTSYNITLETVGPHNLRSTVVFISAFTLPNPVLNLKASPKSTTSVEVKWSLPQGVQQYYKYLVQPYNTIGVLEGIVTVNSSTEVPNLEPGTGYSINVTTIAAENIESTKEQTFSYTMPKAVTNLTVENVSTTSIRLTWLNQSDHKPSYSYWVIAYQDGIMVQNKSTETTNYTFFALTPGKFYTFNVFTVVEGVKSTMTTTSHYTMPEVVSDITAIGSTTNMSVSWTNAIGQVASYTVWLYKESDSQFVKHVLDLSNSTRNTLFMNLTSGVVYCVVVVTKSGPFESNSTSVCNATFPNPPGPIMASQTVNSINFTWPQPKDMDHHQYNFSVSTSNRSFLTENNWFLLDNLLSGSPYNITVVTVGVLKYESTEVTAEYYTKPYPVTMLNETEITTDAVTLVWVQPESKPHYSYKVQISNGSIFASRNVFNTTDTITGLLSGSNYSFIVTTQTKDFTQADPVTVSYFTRPYSIRSLEVETLNTTAIHLNWMEPLEYKNQYTYRVETTGCGYQNNSLTEDSQITVSELTPGSNCTFCVFVRAGNGIEGGASCTSQYTKPEMVQPSISSQGCNSSVWVSWTKPLGKVESYKVYLNISSELFEKHLLSSELNDTMWRFANLSAGMLYSARVITYSGPFNASSGFVTNATFPNPPGPIEIQKKTNSSIAISWKEAPLMTDASFRYHLTNTPPHGDEYDSTMNTSHTFSSLLSGTPYNISVATVGVMGFESEKVQISMVTTRPFSVKNISTSTEEGNITVMWGNPDQYKESYRYNVTWQSPDKDDTNSVLIEGTAHTIKNLVPGSPYGFSVTTETSDRTNGEPSWISDCTDASPVINLTCDGPNKANAELNLRWTTPNGNHTGFQISLNNSIINSTSLCCNNIVSNLRHYTEYKVVLKTLSCGKPSTAVSLFCMSGVTNPPIPTDLQGLLDESAKLYNRFSIEIYGTRLNSTNGPITNIGVLVTDNDVGTSNLTTYLGNTYEQWKAKKTSGYLATVTDTNSQTRSGEGTVSIHVGDESKWEGYTNGPLDTGKYKYAIVLFTYLILNNKDVNIQESVFSITPVYQIILPNNPAIVTGIAVGTTLGIFCVLFIILIGFIIYWKRLSQKESSDIEIHAMRAKVSVAVRVEDYEAYYRKQKADSNCGFAEEFEDLKPVGTGQSKTNALTVDNKPKNRYNNVLPYDSSRVKLSIIHGSPYDDYINANYMSGYNSRKEFIAAQGPLPTTVNEFWRMIWEKNVQTLVMLTRCNEQGRVKCEKYWDSGTKHYENITVTTTSEIPLEDWTIRDFDIKNVKTAETRTVRHFHFTAWPDHGVPETTELLISFRHLVREHMDQYSRHSPTVVHCSAGVGRTGTFIAIDRLIFQIERENIVDVYGIVHDLRMHRPLMVQTEDQYVFLNQCAMDIIRSRTGTNVDLIYQNTAALSIYENVQPKKDSPKSGYHA